MMPDQHGSSSGLSCTTDASIGKAADSLDLTTVFPLQDAQSVVPDNILKSLFTLTEDTLMGRVRFAVEQRNIGRDPVLMQVQVKRAL